MTNSVIQLERRESPILANILSRKWVGVQMCQILNPPPMSSITYGIQGPLGIHLDMLQLTNVVPPI